MNTRSRWEARYALPSDAPHAPPSPLLSEHDRLLPATGLALDVACGDGRNAVWMARRGLAAR